MQKNVRGQMLIQVLAMPMNTNAHGDIFGGWIVSQMDLAAGIYAKRYSAGPAVTVSITDLTFFFPVQVGDLLSCHVELIKVGTKSMTFQVQSWRETLAKEISDKICVAEGTFVFVAIEKNGKSRRIITD